MSGSRVQAVRKRPIQRVPNGQMEETKRTSQATTHEQSSQENIRQFHGYIKEWTIDHSAGQQLGLARSTPGFRTVKMQRVSVSRPIE